MREVKGVGVWRGWGSLCVWDPVSITMSGL